MRKENYHFGVHHCLHSFLLMHVKHFVMKLCSGATSKYMQSVANYFEKTSINLPMSVSFFK